MIILTPIYQSLLDNLNYLSVTILMTIESSAIPFPSEVVVPPAGYMAAEGRMSVILVVIFATLGSIMGAVINYVVSVYVGRPIVYKFVDSRLGHLCLLNREKMERAEAFFNRRGAVATLIGRLLPGIRQLISIPAGLSRMNFGLFILYTAIGSSIWNSILCFLGWYLHRLVPYSQLLVKVKEYEHPIVVGICAIVAIALVWMVGKSLYKRKKTTLPPSE